MVRWGFLGGRVLNNSKKKLLIAYDHPTKDETWAHSILAGRTDSPIDLDVDGFRAYETDVVVIFTPTNSGSNKSHQGWWKLRNGHIAIVNDGSKSNELVFDVIADDAFGLGTWLLDPVKKTDKDFGWAYGQETLPLNP